MTGQKQNTEEQDENRSSPSVSALIASSSTGMSSGLTCTDQCFSPPSLGRSSTTVFEHFDNFNVMAADSALHHGEETMLSALIPDSLWKTMQEAVAQGFLVSFLLTLTEETLTKFLKANEVSDDRIYLINQVIRSLTLIAVGSSVGMVIAAPVANYIMTHLGLSQDRANLVTTGAVVGFDVLTSPLKLADTGVAVLTSVAASAVGSGVARASYNVVNHCFFSEAPRIEEDDPNLHTALVEALHPSELTATVGSKVRTGYSALKQCFFSATPAEDTDMHTTLLEALNP